MVEKHYTYQQPTSRSSPSSSQDKGHMQGEREGEKEKVSEEGKNPT